jgi:hypothetical protein
MTNAELLAKIKAEIERHINELDISDESTLIEAELSDLLSFLSTLESEKPEADLEKEIEISIRLLNGLHTLEDNKSWYKGRYEELKELARNFYELGCRCTAEKYDEIEYNRQRAEELEKPMQEGLEEEMDKFFETMLVLEHENIFEDTFKNIARHFAEWGVEHLKK